MINKKKPFISFILVTRNEENCIEKAINSILNQSYPKDNYELIIVDGMSTDNTRLIIQKIMNRINDQYPNFSVHFFDNEKKILSCGWNIGIENSNGDYVVRIDAHAEASYDFLEKSINSLLKNDAIGVGGKLETHPLDCDNDIISKVLSSPFGVGNSSFRVLNQGGYVDTIVFGLYKKSIFKEVGFYDENFIRNQDLEFHSRVKKRGYKLFFDPQIKSTYYSRNSLKKMLKQGFQNGKWNMVLFKKDFKGLSLRHIIPFAFVLYLLFSIGFGFIFNFLWFICLGVLLLYFVLGLIFAVNKTNKIGEILLMPFVFFLLHISYGLGYFAGIFIKVHKKGE